jgi:hypothetical protein
MAVYTTAGLAGLLVIPLVHHLPLVETGHSTLSAQVELMAVYTTAGLAGLLVIPLAYHSLAETGHSRPVVVVLEVLEVYTMVQARDWQQFVGLRKELGKWMHHI